LPRTGARAPITNRLLDELATRDCARVLDAGERVELSFPDVLAEPGGPMPHVYFPLTSFISLVAPMGGKNHVEVALAGNEGFWGVGIAMGIATSPAHALVQGSGQAIRIEAAAFERELARLPPLRSCINRYAYVVMSQLIQAAGCNRFHVVEQRLARWLLMTADRSHSPSFHLTHEFLAYMLGVRRVGVTKAASALQQRQLISYARGSVTILDRKGLQRASCSCYRCDLTTYARVFG
jgi:CRP-like cAMP-binding protein